MKPTLTGYIRVKNFIIQSPAATVCLEKLIHLHHFLKNQEAKLAFHVHDGYYIYIHKNKYKRNYKHIKNILESPSGLSPELKLKVSYE